MGILRVLDAGIVWEELPRGYGCGSGGTCWRPLWVWRQAGVWDALHQKLLVKLNAAGKIDWSRVAVDASHMRALFLGGGFDRAISGRSCPQRLKARLLVDVSGIPLAVSLTGGEPRRCHAVLPTSRCREVGRPRSKPDRFLAGRGYDHDEYCWLLRALGITR